MVDETMIVVNLDLLAIALVVLVCALAIALRVLWEYRCKHKATLRELHEVLDERDAALQLAGTGLCYRRCLEWVDVTVDALPHKEWVVYYEKFKKMHLG